MTDIGYYELYLARQLQDANDPRRNDSAYIREKADTASALFEENRLHGMTVDQAHEVAMSHLLSDLMEDGEGDAVD